MFLQDVVSEKTIITDLEVADKEEVLKKMTEVLDSAGVLSDRNKFYDSVIERESLESTAIGDGIAIPHAKGDFVKKIFFCFARLKNAVDFNSLDGNPVKMVFLVAAPADMNREYIQIVAKAARLLKSGIMREHLHNAATPKDVLAIFSDFDKILQQSLSVKTKEGRVIHKDM